jgi:hypothetical protein
MRDTNPSECTFSAEIYTETNKNDARYGQGIAFAVGYGGYFEPLRTSIQSWVRYPLPLRVG